MPRVVTLLALVSTAATDTGGTTGTPVEALASMSNVVGVAGATNAIFLNPGHIVTCYIGPLTGQILANLAGLQGVYTSEVNKEAVNTLGYPKYTEADPGGAPVWNYMVDVMRAGSASKVPPVTRGDRVYTYFNDSSELIESFIRDVPEYKRQAPTKGFFNNVDEKQLGQWIYRHRDRIWTMLYGSRRKENAQYAPGTR